MKRKILFISCAVIALIAIAAMIVFVFVGKDDPAPEQDVMDITGTWEVVAMVQDDTPMFLDGQYMSFTDTEAKSFKDANNEPYAESVYSITGNILSLPDIGREYTVTVDTANYMRLYESPEKWMVLVRYPNSDLSEVALDTTHIHGKWNVLYKANGPVSEVLEFTEDTLNDYRNGATTPDASSSYSWKDGNVYAYKWNKEFEYHYISESVIIFVETDTGYIWELERVK